jgi:glycosyltransferase involved in cell wall biosynthesis
MTVAHNEECHAAMRYADKHDLPLVTFFHDWWPDMSGAHKFLKQRIERDFRALYKASDLALCVSAGMRDQLGWHQRAEVLFPIPSATVSHNRSKQQSQISDSKFRLLFSGAFGEYSGMLKEALEYFKDHPSIRLEVRGPNPDWPEEIKDELRSLGLLLPFVDREEFELWIDSADAYLLPMSFDPTQKRRMETSFLSKCTEFSRLSKPLVVWSPSYGSISCWASSKPFTVVVNDARPESLEAALCNVISNPKRLESIKLEASKHLSDEFDPGRIQSQFLGSLLSLSVKALSR